MKQAQLVSGYQQVVMRGVNEKDVWFIESERKKKRILLSSSPLPPSLRPYFLNFSSSQMKGRGGRTGTCKNRQLSHSWHELFSSACFRSLSLIPHLALARICYSPTNDIISTATFQGTENFSHLSLQEKSEQKEDKDYLGQNYDVSVQGELSFRCRKRERKSCKNLLD